VKALCQGFPTFSLHCPPKSKIIKPTSPLVYVSLIRNILEGEGLWVKENVSFASWFLLFTAKFLFRSAKISKNAYKNIQKIYFSN